MMFISLPRRSGICSAFLTTVSGSGELQPIAAFSSLRPLVRDHASSPTKASRGHRIWNSADGVLHVSGGKYTTYRSMSEQAADEIAKEIAPQLAHPRNSADAVAEILASGSPGCCGRA